MDTEGRKRFRLIAGALIAAMLLCGVSETAVAGRIGLIDTKEPLAIFSSADDTSEVLGKAVSGAHVNILMREDGWVQILAGTVIGWIPEENLKETELTVEEAAKANREIMADLTGEEIAEVIFAAGEESTEGENAVGKENTVEKENTAEENEEGAFAAEGEDAGEISAAGEDTAEKAGAAGDEAAEEKNITKEEIAEGMPLEGVPAMNGGENVTGILQELPAEDAETGTPEGVEEIQPPEENMTEELLAAQAAELLLQQEAQRQAAELLLQQQEAQRQAAELLLQQEAQRQAAELLLQQQEAQRQAAELLLQQQEAQRQAEELLRQQQEETLRQSVLEAAGATEDDLYLLANIIYCEAGCESYDGKVAVGSVVMNRVKDAGYPNTIQEVVYDAGQFSPVRNGSLKRALKRSRADESCYQAALDALSGSRPVGECLYFRRVNGRSGLVLGHHVFY